MKAIQLRHAAVVAAALALGLASTAVDAKMKVKVGFIGPLSGGTSSNGIGGRNSADLAVRLRNADAKAKAETMTAEAMKELTGGFELPPGMNLPFG